jgi:hypothetical protein
MNTVTTQTNAELAARLIHSCLETCTPENCDAHQAAIRLSSQALLQVTNEMMRLRRIESELRELCDTYYPPFFPGDSRTVCTACHEVMQAEVLAILDKPDEAALATPRGET